MIAAATTMMAVSSCSKSEKASENTDDRPVLAVSVDPQRAWLEQIVGDRYRIVTLLPSGANPETCEPSRAVRQDLENA